jgi:hypothetical protein
MGTLLKVGDNVRVKFDPHITDYICGGSAIAKYNGQIARISSIISVTERIKAYTLKFRDSFIPPYAFDERALQKLDDPRRIVITTDGKVTKATYTSGSTVITGESSCDERDTFDYDFGAALTLTRCLTELKTLTRCLTELKTLEEAKKESKELLNCKIVITDDGCGKKFKRGGIYEIKDGKFNVDGEILPMIGTLRNLKDLETYFSPFWLRAKQNMPLEELSYYGYEVKYIVINEEGSNG